MKKPRGIRNNNPGNIRHGDNWQGMKEVQTDSAFIQFESPKWGVRAMYRILMNYRKRHGLMTIPQIINRWAPPNENDTDAYIKSAAAKVGIAENMMHMQALNEAQYRELVKAIIYHENGQQPYSDELIDEGIALA